MRLSTPSPRSIQWLLSSCLDHRCRRTPQDASGECPASSLFPLMQTDESSTPTRAPPATRNRATKLPRIPLQRRPHQFRTSGHLLLRDSSSRPSPSDPRAPSLAGCRRIPASASHTRLHRQALPLLSLLRTSRVPWSDPRSDRSSCHLLQLHWSSDSSTHPCNYFSFPRHISIPPLPTNCLKECLMESILFSCCVSEGNNFVS